MAIGTWEDFTSKYGFSDGETLEDRDFRARRHLVRILNKLPAMKGIRVIEFNRSGCHNACLIAVLPNPDGRSDKQLTAEWLEGKLKSCDLPEADIDLQELIDKAYIKARRR